MVRKKNVRQTTTSDAVEILKKQFIHGKSDMENLLAEEKTNFQIAEQIYTLRTAAGLTQQELAQKVKTTPSVICRLESADYDGHSLTMLRRIASALDHQVKISFIPIGHEIET